MTTHGSVAGSMRRTIENLRGANAGLLAQLEEAEAKLFAAGAWAEDRAAVCEDRERLIRERDEARATKDMHKERQEEEITLRLQAEAKLAEARDQVKVWHSTHDSLLGDRDEWRAASQMHERRAEEAQAEVERLRGALEEVAHHADDEWGFMVTVRAALAPEVK